MSHTIKAQREITAWKATTPKLPVVCCTKADPMISSGSFFRHNILNAETATPPPLFLDTSNSFPFVYILNTTCLRLTKYISLHLLSLQSPDYKAFLRKSFILFLHLSSAQHQTEMNSSKHCNQWQQNCPKSVVVCL